METAHLRIAHQNKKSRIYQPDLSHVLSFRSQIHSQVINSPALPGQPLWKPYPHGMGGRSARGQRPAALSADWASQRVCMGTKQVPQHHMP